MTNLESESGDAPAPVITKAQRVGQAAACMVILTGLAGVLGVFDKEGREGIGTTSGISSLGELSRKIGSLPEYAGWQVEDVTDGPWQIEDVSAPVASLRLSPPPADPSDVSRPALGIHMMSWTDQRDASNYVDGFVDGGAGIFLHVCRETEGLFTVVGAAPDRYASQSLRDMLRDSDHC